MSVKDESRVPEFLKMMDELYSTRLEIGIFGDGKGGETHDKGKPITVLGIATINEFGLQIKITDKARNYLRAVGMPLKRGTSHINIPERSFIRSGYDDGKGKMMDRGETLLKKVINLELPVSAFFDALGEYAVGLIQEYLTDIRSPKNHPFTVARKGSSNPLIDTGLLRQSIEYQVVRE